MSIRDINLVSSFFQVGRRYRTSDGKILTLKQICLEDLSPADSEASPINLAGIQVGRQVRTRDGKLLTFGFTDISSKWPYVFKDDDGECFTFTPDGIYSASRQPSAGDIIEILSAPAPKRTKVSLVGLEIGRKVLTKAGETLTFQQVVDETPWPYVFLRENGGTYSYTAEGCYWSGRRPIEKDIVEILPVPTLRLEHVPIGSTFRTRSGAALKLELNFAGEYPFHGRWPASTDKCQYRPDGTSPLGDNYDVVEVISRPEEPRVSINKAVAGDKFRLRSGKIYTHNGVKHDDKLQARCSDDSLYFQSNGVCPNRDSDHEVVELISAARVPIDGAVKGDIFVLRNGERFICTGEINPGTGSKGAKRGDQSFFFRLDGICPGKGGGYDVVELVLAPKVSIEGAKVGDTFRLRGGEEFRCLTSKAVSGYHQAKTKRSGDHLTLSFALDGHCPAWGPSHDVVEVIPAPAPSLVDKVFAQVSRVEPTSIEKVLISSDDYTEHFEAIRVRLFALGRILLRHSSKIDKGRFEIRFK